MLSVSRHPYKRLVNPRRSVVGMCTPVVQCTQSVPALRRMPRPRAEGRTVYEGVMRNGRLLAFHPRRRRTLFLRGGSTATCPRRLHAVGAVECAAFTEPHRRRPAGAGLLSHDDDHALRGESAPLPAV